MSWDGKRKKRKTGPITSGVLNFIEGLDDSQYGRVVSLRRALSKPYAGRKENTKR